MVALWLLSAIGMVFVLFIVGNLVFGGTEQVMVLLSNQCPRVLGETRVLLSEQQKATSQRKSDVEKNAAVSKAFADRLAQLRSSHQLELDTMQGIHAKILPSVVFGYERSCCVCAIQSSAFVIYTIFYRASLAFVRASGRFRSPC